MQHILYELFLNDCLKKLDEKYKEIINKELDKTFFYANLIDFTAYYKLFSKKENKDYGLYTKLHTKKQSETIELLKKEIMENNYDTEALLFLYGYISHLIFDYYIDSYVKNIMTKNKIKDNYKNFKKVSKNIEENFYFEKHKTEIKNHKIKPCSYELSLRMRDLINLVLKDIHYYSMGIKIYQISLNNFKKIKEKFFYKIIYKIFKNNRYTPSLVYRVKKVNKKIDYLNSENAPWYLDGILQVNYSFNQLYEKAIDETVMILNTLNEEIFYKKKNKKQLNYAIKCFNKNKQVIK